MLPLAVCILYRIRVEEEMPIRGFGDGYREYSRNTWKPVPFVYLADSSERIAFSL
jgi:protein-S-isoprenylcysteine O-methyltransferase Ste14